MRSSPTDPPTGGIHSDPDLLTTLEQVVASYRHALEALASGDTQKAEDLVRLAGAELHHLDAPTVAAAGPLGQEAATLHHQLTAIAATAQARIGDQLQELRDSKKAMGSYGGRSHGTGKRLNREG